jgi:nucleotide-binding universal stress UspA family protein
MIKTILVPLDGSPLAEQGLETGCRVARDSGAALVLVRAILYYGLMRENEKAERRTLAEARGYMAEQEERLRRDGFTVRVVVLPSDPVQAILFAADMYDADLIAMSTHGATGLRHALLGSVAEAVLRRSRHPVLLVHAGGDRTPAPLEPFQHILLPLDGTAFAETALTYLAEAQIGRTARITLHRSVAPTTVNPSTMLAGDALAQLFTQAELETDHHRIEAEEYLAATGLAHLRDYSWRPRVTVGSPAEDIAMVADDEHTDLIVMATHGRHGVDRLLHGSVGRALIHDVRLPLLLLPAPCVHAAQAHAQHPDPATR